MTRATTPQIGREANLALLESISKYGGGGFYQTDSASNLPEMFLQDVKSHGGEATMVEKDFTPYTVKPDPLLKDLAGRGVSPDVPRDTGVRDRRRAVERRARRGPVRGHPLNSA